MFFPSFSPWETEAYEEINSKLVNMLTLGRDRRRAEGKEASDGKTWTHGKLLSVVDGSNFDFMMIHEILSRITVDP